MKKTYILFTLAVFAFVFVNCNKEDTLRVGVTLGDLGNPFFVQMGKGAEAGARAIDPNAKVSVVSGNYDISTQTNQIDDFISTEVDIIVLNAVDYEGMAPAAKRARDAGIVVIAADVSIKEGANATITSNNVQAGELGAQYIVEQLGGQGNVVIVNGPPVSAVIDRVNGAKSVFEQYPDIVILSENQNAGGSRDKGLTIMSDLLTALPEIDAVFAINDPTGIGASLAIKQAGRDSEMFVVGIDGAPDAEVELKNADSIFEASSAQDPYTMAQKAVEVGYDIMQGNPPSEETILIPVKLITKDNIDSYKGWTTE